MVGRDVVARAVVNIQDSIPVGPFSSSQVLDVVLLGERVSVIDEREIVTFTRTDRWLQVRWYGSSPEKTVGWLYNGISGEPPYFEPVQ